MTEKQKHFVPFAQKQFDENLILSGIAKFGKDAFADCCDILKPEHFNTFTNQVIYGAMQKIFAGGMPFTITSIFQQTGFPDEKYEEVKAILNNDCDSLGEVRPVALSLRKKRLKEDAINIHRAAINKLMALDESEPTSKFISCGENALFELIAKASVDTDGSPVKIEEIVRKQVTEWMENPVQNVGLPLPWPKFNQSIGGGLRSGVHLVGARLKVGKTSVGLMTALHAATLGIPTLILDTEMMIVDVLPRMIANLAEVEINAVERGLFAKDEFKKKAVFNAVNLLESFRISHKSVGGYEFDDIISTIRRWIYTDVGLTDSGQANPMLVIFDYFKVMSARELATINESQALGFQISKMVDFAKKFNFPCLSFAQLNRDGIEREDSAAVGSSDKLAQIANSLSLFKRKTEKEILSDGPENGNRKMITTDSRYGGETEFASDYISMMMKKESCILLEVAGKPKDAQY